MGDLDCFLRAAWAVRTDADLYSVKSDNDWHYNYPPLCAILMTPLADPPKGHDTAGFMPYPISVAICFLFNVLCMFAAAHFLASAFEQTSDDALIECATSDNAPPKHCAKTIARIERRRCGPEYSPPVEIGRTLMNRRPDKI